MFFKHVHVVYRLFGRLMGRNEILLKAKHLMQQVVSHGAPSPKLSKTLEILIDHFSMLHISLFCLLKYLFILTVP